MSHHAISLGNISSECILGNYYLDFSCAVDSIRAGAYGPVDPKGIPLVDYDRIFKNRWPIKSKCHNIGIHYTPVTTAQYALGLYGQLVATGNPEVRKLFLNQADWLCRNLTVMPDGFALWLHNFPQPSYNLKAPWVSGMAQGQGISALLRAHEITSDKSYVDAAILASQAYQHDLATGGVSVRDSNGYLWFEEYPTAPASHVLNGFIFALWGLYDLWRATEDSEIHSLWSCGIETLKANLPRFDCGGWSRYDLIRTEKAGHDYHMIHIMQLEVMAQLTGEPLFKEYSQLWRRNAEHANLKLLSASRIIRGVLRRLGLIQRPVLTGISVVCPPCNKGTALDA